ncbi:MAG TPA: methyltransferase domain-containing protein [Solirubrobacterales bacterium]
MASSLLISLASAVLHVPPPERALVVGCADGEAVLLLAREFPAARVRGLDPSADLVRQATAQVGLDPEGRVAFKVGKASSLPYPDQFFDLVVQPRGAPRPKEVARVLGPGGHLIFSEHPRWAPRPRPESLARGLARHGFVAVWTEAAGNGNFYVARLGRPD